MSSSTQPHPDETFLAPELISGSEYDRQKSDKALLIALPMVLAFVGLILGGIWSVGRYFQSPSGYESRAIVSIARTDSSDLQRVNHVELIQSRRVVEPILFRNGGKLGKLKCFDDIHNDKRVELVQQNLIVESLTDDGTVVSLKLLTSNKDDSPILLNNLVQEYEEWLFDNEVAQTAAELSQLIFIVDNFTNQKKIKEDEIRQYENELAVTDHKLIIKQLSAQLIQDRDILRQKVNIKTRIEKALAESDAERNNLIWALQERGHINTFPDHFTSAESRKADVDSTVKTDTDDTAMNLNENVKLTLSRLQALLDDEIEEFSTRFAELGNTLELHKTEAKKQEELRRTIARRQSELVGINKDLRIFRQKKATLNAQHQERSIRNWKFERMEVADEGTYTTRITTYEIFQSLLTGTIACFTIGVAFSLIMK